MDSSEDLVALNREIAHRETAGDRGWFEQLLAPTFAMRRAGGTLVDRVDFLDNVAPSAIRGTDDIDVDEAEVSAVVTCVVSVRQPDGSWESYRNSRLFTRADTGSGWQLLGWANERLGRP